MTTEFRVVWKRDAVKRKVRVFKTRRGAARFMVLFGPEPWTAYPQRRYGQTLGPDDYNCCAGTVYDECACGGVTIREYHEQRRKETPPLEYLRLETREVGEWSPLSTAGVVGR